MRNALVLVVTVVVVATVGVAAQGNTFKEKINVSPGQTLDLQLEIGGRVRIVGSDEASVSVSAIFTGGDAADIVVAARPTPRGVEISSEYASRRGHRSSDVTFEIRVPRRFNVHLESVRGAVNVTDIEGAIDGRTIAGDLVLSGLRGRVSLSTMRGDIRLMRSEVDGTLSTMRGNVFIEDVVGDVKISSMGGTRLTTIRTIRSRCRLR